MCLRGPAPTPSVKKLMPMPISSPRLALLGLLAAQLVVAGHLHRQLAACAGSRRSRTPSRSCVSVGELLGLDQVLQPQLGGVHVQLGGEAVDHPLDQVDRLGDPERAGVGDAARRLVRVDAGDLAVRGLRGRSCR